MPPTANTSGSGQRRRRREPYEHGPNWWGDAKRSQITGSCVAEPLRWKKASEIADDVPDDAYVGATYDGDSHYFATVNKHRLQPGWPWAVHYNDPADKLENHSIILGYTGPTVAIPVTTGIADTLDDAKNACQNAVDEHLYGPEMAFWATVERTVAWCPVENNAAAQ